MPLYIDTLGETVAAVAVCDRCHLKVKIGALISDPNSPGLRVCEDGCVDIFDPYRLPARQTEDITLRYPRPEEPLTVPPAGTPDGPDWTTTQTGSYK